jgi:hypothetical protein
MGRAWDKLPPGLDWAKACYRVLKPGGYILAFGGSRTSHRLAVAIEDAGFEIRDSIVWLYGQGFPKSHNVANDIDKMNGCPARGRQVLTTAGSMVDHENRDRSHEGVAYQARSPEAEPWTGWGTALKPGHEPIVVARKPFKGTVAANVLAYGTGAINVDATRIGTTDKLGGGQTSGAVKFQHEGWNRPWMDDPEVVARVAEDAKASVAKAESLGRWPANVVLSHGEGCVQVGTRTVNENLGGRASLNSWRKAEDRTDVPEAPVVVNSINGEVPVWECEPGCPVAELDVQSGVSQSKSANRGLQYSDRAGGIADGGPNPVPGTDTVRGHEDSGGASRFFYCGKASTKERPFYYVDGDGPTDSDNLRRVCSTCGKRGVAPSADQPRCTCETPDWKPRGRRKIVHPTVKPLALMRWLVRMVTPPGGLVLDTFAGSGATGEAALLEDMNCYLIEQDAEYLPLIQIRSDRVPRPAA